MEHSHIISSKLLSLRRLIALIISILVLGGAGYGIRQWYLARTPWANVHFQQFEPKQLPKDVSIQGAMLGVWTKTGKGVPYQTSLDLKLSDSNIKIRQFAASDVRQDCDRRIVNQTCEFKETAGHQPYRLIITKDQAGQISERQFGFAKEDTYIFIEAQNERATLGHNWEQTIDSFQPATFKNAEIRHFTPGP